MTSPNKMRNRLNLHDMNGNDKVLVLNDEAYAARKMGYLKLNVMVMYA